MLKRVTKFFPSMAFNFTTKPFFYASLISGFAYAEESSEKLTDRKPQSGFFYGAMLGFNNEIYQGVDNDFKAFPVIGYKSDRFNFLGPLISYTLLNVNHYALTSMMRYRFAGYDSSDSAIFEGMEDRKSSLDLGFGLSYKQDDWSTQIDVLHDVIGASNATEIKANIGRTFFWGPIFIEPNFGLSYWDNQYVDYYYGVEAEEATLEREFYTGKYSVNPKLGLNISTPIFFDGFSRLALEQTWYGSSVRRSPLAGKHANVSLRFTFSRFF